MVLRWTTPSPPYHHQQLTSTIHVLVHHDKFREYPFIYVKLHPQVPVLTVIDTGCGSKYTAGNIPSPYDDLRTFLETFNIPPNENSGWKGGPLNPFGSRTYLIITTHVHYDHIGGIQNLACRPGAKVLSSGHDREFIGSVEARRKHSLVDGVGVILPEYEISRFVDDREEVSWPIVCNAKDRGERGDEHESTGTKLGLVTLHTPGHTPDSLTLYDKQEGWLFTGDTFYGRQSTISLPWDPEFRQAIIFPIQGDWLDFYGTLMKLVNFVATEEALGQKKEVQVACAHTTCGISAKDHLQSVLRYFNRWGDGEVPIKEKYLLHGVEMVLWQDPGDPQFSVLAPVDFAEPHERSTA